MQRQRRAGNAGYRNMALAGQSRGTLIDHTTCETLFHYLEEHNNGNGKAPLEIEGLDACGAFPATKAACGWEFKP